MTEPTNNVESVRAAVAELMPRLLDDLRRYVEIPSVAFPGFPTEPVLAAHDLVVELLSEAGASDVESIRLPDTSPAVFATIPGPEGSPTVLLYTHYDVVPEGDPSAWKTPAFSAIDAKDEAGRDIIIGRGSADSKANLMLHLGALRYFEGKPPVTLKIVVEGQEEFGSDFDSYPPSAPERFAADAMIIADVGNIRPGVPTVTVALRGSAAVDVEVNTLASPKHSGLFGGAAPDAVIVLLHALSSLHDADGNVAVAGLLRNEWAGTTYTDDEFRELAEILPGVEPFGTGGLGSRIWSGPAVSVIGIDVASVDTSLNAVAAHARARINLRVHPEQNAVEAQQALVTHLENLKPFGVSLTVVAGEAGNGFAAKTDGPAYTALSAALTEAFETPATTAAAGGSIPLVNSLQQAVPGAEVLLFGATDGFSNIHAPNERVVVDEIERSVLAEILFLSTLGSQPAHDH
ncbi:M20/M25/M40 family metallo-hydrolase [Lysinibacter cavernae]|uniref:Acetylornithine deacetylase/succinyl-diaminopimelate desuccinylase-like protein n=1 Tax=Lysinibacter cavernae TaxID=1640652 RepID=A0A7X5QZZ9_9MICO|nr:M20/M25/M40 family metallo-hydrolase [Lysinibacter cavernae]NIH53118.1 acetylornithine deacetylase/succinyl-diaminopimelate desuccinylase-like protein [Lysinibacter cavernae]